MKRLAVALAIVAPLAGAAGLIAWGGAPGGKAIAADVAKDPAATPAGDVAVRRERPNISASCSAIDQNGGGTPGGCTVRVRSNRPHPELIVRTVVGNFRFAPCGIDFRMSITGDGRAWMDRVVFTGSPPCNDILPCSDAGNTWMWPGTILTLDRPGEFAYSVELCVDTCLGRFEGRVVMTLRRAARGWRLVAAKAPVGGSGFEIDGSWRLDSGLVFAPNPQLPGAGS